MKQNSSTHERLADRLANILTMLNMGSHLARLCYTNLYLRFIPQYNFQMNKPTPKIYRTTNWPAYNRALMSRGNIAIWFDPAT